MQLGTACDHKSDLRLGLPPMLQRLSSRLLLSSTQAVLQHATIAGCVQLQQQQQQQQQLRMQSSSSAGPGLGAADAHSSSGWSWFGGAASQHAGSSAGSSEPQHEVTPSSSLHTPDPTAAAAAEAAETAAEAPIVEAAAVLPPPEGSAADILQQADALVEVSAAATEATLAAVDASFWLPTSRWVTNLMLMARDDLHLPWFEAIMVTNVALKLLAVPIAVYQQKNAPAMQVLNEERQKLVKLQEKMAQAATGPQYAERYDEYVQAATAFKDKYAGKRMWLSPVLSLANVVVLISQFSAVSTLARSTVPTMTYEGAFWFKDLTLADPVMGLPLICAAATLAQFSSKRFQDILASAAPGAQYMKPLGYFAAVLLLVFGWWTPSAIVLLWASNSIFAIAQNTLLSSPGFRAAFKLPALPATAAAAAATSASLPPGLQRLFGMQQPQADTSAPQPAPAAAARAPPPGVRLSKRRRRV